MKDKSIEQLADEYCLRVEHLNEYASLGFIAGYQQAQQEPNWVSEIFRFDKPWSLLEVMKKLVGASDILLHQKDYDRMGWEEHEHAYREGKAIIELLSNINPTTSEIPNGSQK